MLPGSLAEGQDAHQRPRPGRAPGRGTSYAESWTVSKDALTYEFVLRKGVKFHNGDTVTAEDVRFSFDRYHGAGAKLLKDRVREVQIVDALQLFREALVALHHGLHFGLLRGRCRLVAADEQHVAHTSLLHRESLGHPWAARAPAATHPIRRR
jgi:hypothetical protein